MAQQPFDRVQHAWMVHQAVQTWTNQAETKATFLLTIESAIFVFFINRLGQPDVFADLDPQKVIAPAIATLMGMALLARAIVFLVMVVYPRLREKELEREKWRNAIYFGHLAGQDAKAIENTLRRRDPLEQLARQLREMSDIALQKHRLLKQSIISASWGFGLILLGFLIWTLIRPE